MPGFDRLADSGRPIAYMSVPMYPKKIERCNRGAIFSERLDHKEPSGLSINTNASSRSRRVDSSRDRALKRAINKKEKREELCFSYSPTFTNMKYIPSGNVAVNSAIICSPTAGSIIPHETISSISPTRTPRGIIHHLFS